MDSRKIFGAFVIAAALFFFWPTVIGGWQEISALKTAVTEREGLLTTRKQVLANIDTAYTEYQTKLTVQDGQKFAALVPVKKDTAEILSAIDDIGNQSGVTVAEVHITDTQGPTTDQFKSTTIVLDMSGTYASLRTFLSNLEKYVRLLNVESIEIATDPNNSNRLRFSVRADAYFLK